MTKEKLSNYLTDVPKPEAPATENEKLVRLALLSARRSAAIGVILIALPGLLIFLLFLQNTLHLFPGLTRWLAGSGSFLPLPARAIVVFIFLVGFPFVAVAVNLLSISWYRYYHFRRELVISIRMRWPNILIAIIGSALAAFYILHLLADTLLGGK
ncbi:MAG TPA: hypothetical protein VGS79_16760 [Puia sp.]|nr:hypothetical protein [Puia sp.]